MAGWSVKGESKAVIQGRVGRGKRGGEKKATQETRREKGDECPVGRKERKERGK